MKFSRIFQFIFLISTIIGFIILFNFVVLQDISLEPIHKSTENRPNFPIYLATYADGDDVFFQNRNFLIHSALNKGIDHFLNYNRSHIDKVFVDNNQEILNNPFGRGLWLWKPWIILETLKNVPENSVVIYADVGFCFCGSLETLWNKLKGHDIVLAYYDKPFIIDEIIKPQILQSHKTDNTKLFKHGNFMAGFMVIRNNKRTRTFIESWLTLCKKKNHLSGEGFGPGIHQHDQSILYLAHALRDHNLKVNYIEEKELGQVVNWHHRKPSREHLSLIPYLRKHLTPLERKIWNTAGFSHIRYFYRNHIKTLLERKPIAENGL